MILYFVTEREHSFNQLEKKLLQVQNGHSIDLAKLIEELKSHNLIRQEEDMVKINLMGLLTKVS